MEKIINTLQKIKSERENIFNDLAFNVDMSNYVTFRTSGIVSCLYEPKSIDDLKYFLNFLKNNNINFFVIGKGSNLLVHGKGYNGVAIKIGKNFSNYEIIKKDNNNYEVYCESGANLTFISNKTFDSALTGLEPISLIPGTIGGAIYMNAGSYGKEIKDVLKSVLVLNTKTFEIEKFTNEMCKLDYRKSFFMNDEYIILSCVINVSKGEKETILNTVKEFRDKRKASQPLDKPNAGSTFKRPKDDFAGRLIEVCNLKGKSIGGAKVSEKHAGFIVNYDNAIPEDILSLIEEVKEIVYKEQGVMLEEELRIIK